MFMHDLSLSSTDLILELSTMCVGGAHKNPQGF